MNKKILIGCLIIILIICLLVIIICIGSNKKNVSEESNEINETNQNNVNENTNNINEIDDNISSNTNANSNDTEESYTIESENIDANVTEDEEFDIFNNEIETGNVQYSRDQLNNFELNLNISNEALQYITDYDEFYITIKEYVYKNGLVDADIAEMEQYQYDQANNRVGVVFQLNNDDKDKILAVFYLSNRTTEVYNY